MSITSDFADGITAGLSDGGGGLVAYVAACLLIELTPGPNMGFLAIVAATRGRRLGFATTAGIALGLLVVGLLAALGVAQLVEASPLAWQALRWGGVGYLLWLAWTQWRDAADDASGQGMDAGVSDGRYFRHGLVVNLLNPKAAIFYVAVLPSFVGDAEGAVAVRAVALTLLYVAIATAIHLAIVGLAGRLRPWLSDAHLHRRVTATRALALLLVVVAGWMALKTR